MNDTPVLSLRAVSKSFGGVAALRGVDLDVMSGEVHGLLGHNGSGKSTLIKILSGFHDPEPGGTLALNGNSVRLPLPPGGFRDQGIAFVHQDLALIDSLSVVENLRIGRIASTSQLHINWGREAKKTSDLLHEFGIDASPWTEVGQLPAWQRPLLAIVRAVDEMRTAIASDPQRRGLLVLDEPTATLSETGIKQLFDVVRQVARDGHGVLFVSHDLDEVVELTDQLTVLRDGQVAGSATTGEVTNDQLVEMIVGAALVQKEVSSPGPPGEMRARIHGLFGPSVEHFDLELRAGEIVGLTGLVGSGYEDIGPVIFGALPGGGKIDVKGRTHDLTRMTPRTAVAMGIGFVPGDRLKQGCISSLTAMENVGTPVVRRFWRRGRIDISTMREHTRSLMTELGTNPSRPDLDLDAFSGGNQQKILLAKWLQLDPSILILIEPTQGVDVGARSAILDLVRNCAAEGTAVLCASSDQDQLAELCHRVVVMRRGRVGSELSASDVTKDLISSECFKDSAPSEDDMLPETDRSLT